MSQEKRLSFTPPNREQRSSVIRDKRSSLATSNNDKRSSMLSTRSKRSSFTTQEKRTSAIIFRQDDPESSSSVLKDVNIPDNLINLTLPRAPGISGSEASSSPSHSPFEAPLGYKRFSQISQHYSGSNKRSSAASYQVQRPLSAYLSPGRSASSGQDGASDFSVSSPRSSSYSTSGHQIQTRQHGAPQSGQIMPQENPFLQTPEEDVFVNPFTDTAFPATQSPSPKAVDFFVPTSVQEKPGTVRGDMRELQARARVRGKALQRKAWAQILFEYSFYTFLVAFVYLVLVGRPLWKGAVWWLYWVVSRYFYLQGGWAITIGLAALYTFPPLLILFESDPPMPDAVEITDPEMGRDNVGDTALLIPCYKSENIIGPTLEAALKIFPARNIFVIANGNSPTPLDNTEDVCRHYSVNHIWSPVGSKIVAQFVGCYAAKDFQYTLLIDDDCALPPNFPVVSDRITGKVKSIGYTIKSVGPESSKGTFCQQAQDLEYKISGLQRALAGKVGSVTFPHGAISLWDREFLVDIFFDHPGFSVSEDWFFGHSCRRLGGRIQMCTAVFVETETPAALFFNNSGSSRGGFGEMTVFKQRFLRWNFFFVNGMYYNMSYILGSWRLGFWELGAKLFVFQEVYETLLYLLTPFILPISFIVQAKFTGIMLAVTFAMYLLNVLIFNEVHLRRKHERVAWSVVLWYYMPYKFILTFVNVASCYWSLFKYARYFATRHPKVIEDEKAVAVVCDLEERKSSNSLSDDI